MRAGNCPSPIRCPRCSWGCFLERSFRSAHYRIRGSSSLAVTALMPRYRKKDRAAERRRGCAWRFEQVWVTGALVVSPTLAVKPPRHGWGALAVRSMSFCKQGTSLTPPVSADPVRDVPGDAGAPRSLQIIGPARIRRGPQAARGSRRRSRSRLLEVDRFWASRTSRRSTRATRSRR